MKTRDKILQSAWKLFAEEGFEAVSVRDVTNHADVNLASVSYHFGSKSGLIQEIIAMALVPLNRQRVVLLKQAGDEAGGVENVSLHGIIECFVKPIVEPEAYGGSASMIARLIARYLIDIEYDVPDSVMEAFSDVYKIFGTAIHAQCPDIEPKEALEKMIYSTGAIFMYQAFSGQATKATSARYNLNSDDYLDSAVKFCVAGFSS